MFNVEIWNVETGNSGLGRNSDDAMDLASVHDRRYRINPCIGACAS
jgi:hypothetical protein